MHRRSNAAGLSPRAVKPSYDVLVLKGTRLAILRRVQPISIHGQVSCDVSFSDSDDPDGTVHTARVGPEAMTPGLGPGDSIRLEYLMGVVTSVTREPREKA